MSRVAMLQARTLVQELLESKSQLDPLHGERYEVKRDSAGADCCVQVTLTPNITGPCRLFIVLSEKDF
jgi:hypothetical protein